MSNEEPYIIEDTEVKSPDLSSVSPSRFPVRVQLLVLGVFMCLLFAGIIMPKTISSLGIKSTEPNAPVTVAQVSNDNGALTLALIDDVNLKAESAFVFDVAKHQVLYEKNSEDVLPLASITKLMTALVAYEVLPDETPVTISGVAAAQQSGGSLEVGETFPIKKLADFALISSYNSAAYTLASSVGELLGEGDPVAQFVAAMNIKAEELELDSLLYYNPTGLDISATEAGAYGSARDTTMLVEYILREYPEILVPTVTDYIRLYNQNGEYHEAHNTNTVLADIPNLLGSKTGYTDLAGGNLTIVFDAGYNRPVIITVLGSSRNERFSDAKKLVAEVQSMMSNPE